MKKLSRLALSLVFLASFAVPTSVAFAQTGASCTGNGQGTCNPGYDCVVTGEGYNTCQPSPAGASIGSPSSGQTGTSCTGSGQGTCGPGYNCVVVGEGYNQCIPSTIIPAGTVAPTNSGMNPGTGAGTVNKTYLRFYYDLVLTIVNSYLVPVLFAIAFIVILWGVYRAFIWHGDSDTEREKGRQFILWGVIGFVIITSIWGLVNVVKDTFIPSSVSNKHPGYPTI